MCAWLVNWTSAINTHTTSAINTHTHTHNDSSLRFAVSCFVFFRAKCFLIQLLKFLFCRHPGKGVQYLLFVTASNSKILKSQLSSLSRSCTIQGGTSLMVFGTERRLWLRFTSVKMEFGITTFLDYLPPHAEFNLENNCFSRNTTLFLT